MKIVSIRHRSVPIHSSIRNAVIDFSEMTVSVVVIESDVRRNGAALKGYGFTSNGRYSAGGILEDRIVPRLLRTDPDKLVDDSRDNLDPFKAWHVMMRNEKPGGHGERTVAVGAIDMALWDLVAKIEDKPLYRLLAERFNQRKSESRIYVYAAGGYYYPGKGVEALQDEIRGYLDQGYDTVKMKIGGAPLDEDLRRIESVLSIVGDASKIAVDANGRFEAKDAVKWGKALAPYGLKWYEEPVDPLDYAGMAEVAQEYGPPLATGENLFSLPDSRNLVLFGGLRSDRDFLQMDPALSYGLVEYLRILKMLEENGWSRRSCIPHGGHQFSLHLAGGLGIGGNESYPGVFEPFGGFGDGVLPENGRVELPDAPGIGIELKSKLMKTIRQIEE